MGKRIRRHVDPYQCRIVVSPEIWLDRYRDHGEGDIWLDLGCGKGEFIADLARRRPEIFFIGLEIRGNGFTVASALLTPSNDSPVIVEGFLVLENLQVGITNLVFDTVAGLQPGSFTVTAYRAVLFPEVTAGTPVKGMVTLIDLVLSRYRHHPSVIGFGIDVEWHRWSDENQEGVAVSDDQANTWLATIRRHNPDYRLFLKTRRYNEELEQYKEVNLFSAVPAGDSLLTEILWDLPLDDEHEMVFEVGRRGVRSSPP